MLFVFDTSSLIAMPRDAIVANAAVPIATLQELLAGVNTSDHRREARNRAALRKVATQPGWTFVPGFGDMVREAFGQRQRYWPQEERGWRILSRAAGDGRPWPDLAAQWNALRLAGRVELSELEYTTLKQNAGAFQREYQDGVDAIRREAPVSSDELSLDNSAMSRTFPDGTGAPRTIPELLIMAQLAGVADVAGITDMLDAAEAAGEELRGRLRFVAGRHAMSLYQGGLDFVTKVTAQLLMDYSLGQRHVDGNDYFDWLIMASVDDDPETRFVIQEQRIHDAAGRVGLGSRVLRVEDLAQ